MTHLRAVVLASLYAAFNLLPVAALTVVVLDPASGALSVQRLWSGGLYLLSWLALTSSMGYVSRRCLKLPVMYGLLGGTVLWVGLAPVTPETRLVFCLYLLGGLQGGALYALCTAQFYRPWFITLLIGLLMGILSGAFCAFVVTCASAAGVGIRGGVLLATSLLALAGPASTPLRQGIERWERRWRRPRPASRLS